MSDFPIFSVLGIEIEYMLVDKHQLNVQPKSDLILTALTGQLANEVELGDIAISNELVMHVLELKNNGPKPPTAPIVEQFQKALLNLQPILEQQDLILLPTGAHPWMNPHKETKRWPHGNNEIYKQFDSIFNCQGHGWSNLQSMHVNLPYSNEEEFCQLHNAIRLIVPILPALAASTPLLDSKPTGYLDSRLHYYCNNQISIPSISGDVVPEFIKTQQEYQQQILEPMYKDISPFDPKGILQHQWLNSRAAIPKFDQKAIEIRIIDSQECVVADIAIAKATLAILKKWQNNSHYYLDNPCDTKPLKMLFNDAIQNGMAVQIDNSKLTKQWQLLKSPSNLKGLWSALIEGISSELNQNEQLALELILSQGNLSERILRATGHDFQKSSLKRIYNQLAYCLISNQQFMP